MAGREGGRKECNEVGRKERREEGVSMYVIVCEIRKWIVDQWSMFFFFQNAILKHSIS